MPQFDEMNTAFQTRFGRPLYVTGGPDTPMHRRLHNGAARDVRSRDLSPEQGEFLSTEAPRYGLREKIATGRESWATGPHRHYEAVKQTGVNLDDLTGGADSILSKYGIGGQTQQPARVAPERVTPAAPSSGGDVDTGADDILKKYGIGGAAAAAPSSPASITRPEFAENETPTPEKIGQLQQYLLNKTKDYPGAGSTISTAPIQPRVDTTPLDLSKLDKSNIPAPVASPRGNMFEYGNEGANVLPADREKQFQAWYSERAKRLKLNPNPDDPRHFYNYRAAFEAGAEPDPVTHHWPSQFKLPGHPNQFVNGIDTITGKPVPTRTPVRLPAASRRVGERADKIIRTPKRELTEADYDEIDGLVARFNIAKDTLAVARRNDAASGQVSKGREHWEGELVSTAAALRRKGVEVGLGDAPYVKTERNLWEKFENAKAYAYQSDDPAERGRRLESAREIARELKAKHGFEIGLGDDPYVKPPASLARQNSDPVRRAAPPRMTPHVRPISDMPEDVQRSYSEAAARDAKRMRGESIQVGPGVFPYEVKQHGGVISGAMDNPATRGVEAVSTLLAGLSRGLFADTVGARFGNENYTVGSVLDAAAKKFYTGETPPGYEWITGVAVKKAAEKAGIDPNNEGVQFLANSLDIASDPLTYAAMRGVKARGPKGRPVERVRPVEAPRVGSPAVAAESSGMGRVARTAGGEEGFISFGGKDSATLRSELGVARSELDILNARRMAGENVTKDILAARDRVAGLEKRLGRVEGAEARRANRPPLGERVTGIANIPKTLKSSGDLSAVARQGVFFYATNPRESIKATGQMLRSFKRTGFEKVKADLASHPKAWLAEDSGLYQSWKADGKLSATEEAWLGSSPLKNVPGVNKWVDFSERTFTSFLDSQRMEVFSALADELISHGKTFASHPQEFKDIARLVNWGTGRGSLGKLDQFVPALNAALFSPRLLASRFQVVASPITLSGRARWIAARKLFRFTTTMGAALGLAKYAGAEVGLDPTETDFAKIKVGDTRYDLLGGFQQDAVFIARLGAAFLRESKGEKQPRNADPGSIVLNFLRQKEAPLVSSAHNLMTGEPGLVRGKDLTGEKTSLKWEKDHKFEPWQMVAPMFLEDLRQAWLAENGAGVAKSLPGVIGVGVKTYKDRYADSPRYKSLLENPYYQKGVEGYDTKQFQDAAKREAKRATGKDREYGRESSSEESELVMHNATVKIERDQFLKEAREDELYKSLNKYERRSFERSVKARYAALRAKYGADDVVGSLDQAIDRFSKYQGEAGRAALFADVYEKLMDKE